MDSKGRGFTLIELLIVIAIIGILISIVLPALSRARTSGRTLVCLAHLRELGKGWQMYADENDDFLLPGRMFNQKPKGPSNPGNWYDVGNGLKYRPRWVATMGTQVGAFAFTKPELPPWSPDASPTPHYDRQDYDHDVYQCPAVASWVDERNYAFGYNHQFLGNARQTRGRFHHFPVKLHRITAPSATVVAGDCMGTAAGFPAQERGSYDNDGKAYPSLGNHGWTLDPPRLIDQSDRGADGPGSPRSAVDPRHQGKVNVVYTDSHGAKMTDLELGYRKNADGEYVDDQPDDPAHPEGTGSDAARNNFFSGTGRDDDPPRLPGS